MHHDMTVLILLCSARHNVLGRDTLHYINTCSLAIYVSLVRPFTTFIMIKKTCRLVAATCIGRRIEYLFTREKS